MNDVISPRTATVKQRRRGPKIIWAVVMLISLAIAYAFVVPYYSGSLAALAKAGQGLAKVYADRPVAIQIAFYCHITFAGLALVVGPFQFVKAIRRRNVKVHRWIGRVYIAAVAIGAVAAFVMSFVSSVGFDGFFGFGSLAVLWAWTTYRGYRAARNRDFASHQAWMIRSFALTFAAPTLRIWLGTLIGVQLFFVHGVSGAQAFQNAYLVLPWLCWIPNIVVAEFIVRRRNLPGLRFSSSSTSGQRETAPTTSG
jgi:uncharacterized membrane protein